MIYNTEITADIGLSENGTQRAAPHIWAKQRDSARSLTVTLTENGEALTIPSGATAELRVLRPDGVLETTSGAISGNTVTATLAPEMLYRAGDCMAEIRLTNGTEILASQLMVLHVQPCAVGKAGTGWESDTVANLVLLDKAQYDAVSPHSANTLYIVTSGASVLLYLGDVLITAGGGDSSALEARVGALETSLGGLSFVAESEADYEAETTHDDDTVYILTEADS